ncbi:MAG TPA: Gfo/Idh/MocA family oxidoreductase [Tepidiformaceae bacterium]|nr:Gfo/Idh/MocA family oxidoreductase [Tepidiformaceae bacterium]
MPLRIGLIGAGGNTRSMHIPGFQKIDGVEVAAVCNRTRLSGQRVADEFGIAKVYTDVADLLADSSIDAVCIGTWPYKHREFTTAALRAGKHVLCEARMAMDLAEAREMLAASEIHPSLVAQLVPAPFDFQLGPTITRLVDEGALGELMEVTVTGLNGSGLDPSTPIHWRNVIKYSGRNIMMLGIYAEVIQRWLGDTLTVVADGRIAVNERPGGPDGAPQRVDVPDSFAVLGQLANGARISYQLSAVAAGGPPPGISLYGSKSTLHWTMGDRATLAAHGQKPEALQPDPGSNRGWCVEEDFVRSIREGAPVTLTSFADGVRYMRFVDAAWQSWRESRRVAL